MMLQHAPSFQPLKAPGTELTGEPLLDPRGPRVVLGWNDGGLPVPLKPSPASLFGPRGVCLHPDGSFWVADTGHHRLLGWHEVPGRDNVPANIIIGQPDFASEGRNGRASPGPATLNVPTGVTAWGEGLAVADAWNHRVLLWRRCPADSNQPADIVLGQQDKVSVKANRGRSTLDAASLHWPYGVDGLCGGRLAVCDTGNRRVLIWESVDGDGQPADHVLGQSDFSTRDENAGGAVDARSMRWPHQAALWQGRLVLADAGNNRVMVWDDVPTRDGALASMVLGQTEMSACDHNRGGYYPSDKTLNMPYALAGADGWLIIADTANSRLLGWHTARMGAAAATLTGQPDFASKGDNGWMSPQRDSLCWPYGLSAAGNLVAIADSGNNRVLLWELANGDR